MIMSKNIKEYYQPYVDEVIKSMEYELKWSLRNSTCGDNGVVTMSIKTLKEWMEKLKKAPMK